MLFSRINLREELFREKNHQNQLLDDVKLILTDSENHEKAIHARLSESSGLNEYGQAVIKEDSDFFTLDQIKKICIKFRLRFLDSSHFRSEYPYEAILKVKSIEQKYGIKITSFRIMAPAESFDLENINKDPLLFAQINEQEYLLLHKWGSDLAWYRKLLCWPLQSFRNLLIAIMVASFIFAFTLPSSVMNIFSFESELYLRIWLAIHTFIGFLGLTIFAGVSYDKSLSSMNWESKYYNY